MSVKLNEKFIKDFVDADAVEKIAPEVEAALETVKSGTGAGADFLGWYTRPVDYDKDEYARIKDAAARIRKNSDVLIVIAVIVTAGHVIGHAVNILNCGKRVLKFCLFLTVEPLEHHPNRVGFPRRRKFLFHKRNTLLHRGIVRQIFGHVRVYADLRYQKSADRGQYQHGGKNDIPFIYNKACKPFHKHTSRITVDKPLYIQYNYNQV